MGLEVRVKVSVRVRARARDCHGRGREAGRRPRRTGVAPGATEAALVGGVARPLQADHELGAKGSGASFELGSGRGGRHIAERGEEHIVMLCAAAVCLRLFNCELQQLGKTVAGSKSVCEGINDQPHCLGGLTRHN